MPRIPFLFVAVVLAAGAGIYFTGGPKAPAAGCADISNYQEQRDCIAKEAKSSEIQRPSNTEDPVGSQ